MTIYVGSRYEREPVSRVADANGDYHLTLFMRSPGKRYNSTPFTWTNYIVKDNDRLDNVSYQFYGIPDLWWLIADANPEILDPMSLTTGAVLRIPNYRQVQEIKLPSSGVNGFSVQGEPTSGVSLR